MRIRFRYSLTTLLLLPLLVGIGIKWYRGPHEYSAEEPLTPATLRESIGPDPLARSVVTHPRKTSFWAYRTLDGSLTRHGMEISTGFRGDKVQVEFRGGERNGEFRYWNAKGELVCEGQFEHDEPAGEWAYYRYGIAYQRLKYEDDGDREVQDRYDLDRLAERRVRARGADEVLLTAWHWHANHQRRLEGRLIKDRPVGKWHWWDESGRELLTITFHDGIPAEFVGRSKLTQLMLADFGTEFENASLERVVGELARCGFHLGVECDQEDLRLVQRLGLSTASEFHDGLALYVALRMARLTLDIRKETDGVETLVVVPTG